MSATAKPRLSMAVTSGTVVQQAPRHPATARQCEILSAEAGKKVAGWSQADHRRGPVPSRVARRPGSAGAVDAESPAARLRRLRTPGEPWRTLPTPSLASLASRVGALRRRPGPARSGRLQQPHKRLEDVPELIGDVSERALYRGAGSHAAPAGEVAETPSRGRGRSSREQPDVDHIPDPLSSSRSGP